MRCAWVAVLLVLFAPDARADDANRTVVERLFLQGRLQDLDVVVDQDDPWQRFTLLVRDHYWRRTDAALEDAPPTADELLKRRWAWLRAVRNEDAARYPLSDDDPMPVLSALIRERELREGHGDDKERISAAPLRELVLEGAEADARDVGLYFVEVHEEFTPHPDDLASVVRAESIATRNAWIGMGAVLLLVLATVLLGRRLGPSETTRSAAG